jgi:hypothetical protein
MTWNYGPALGTGVLTALVAAVTGAIVTYIYFSFVNPGMPDLIHQMQVAKMHAKGMSDTDIERATGFMKIFTSPGVMACMQILGGMFFGTLISLVVAIFFRKPVATTEPPEFAAPPAI